MQEILGTKIVGYVAVDGHTFYDLPNDAENKCLEYEKSLVNVLLNELQKKGVVVSTISNPKEVFETKVVNQNGDKVYYGSNKFYAEPRFTNFLGLYEDTSLSFVFAPKTEDDIKQLLIIADAKGCKKVTVLDKPDDFAKITVGTTYVVTMDDDCSRTTIYSEEGLKNYLKETARKAFNQAKAFLNPKDYVFVESPEINDCRDLHFEPKEQQ